MIESVPLNYIHRNVREVKPPIPRDIVKVELVATEITHMGEVVMLGMFNIVHGFPLLASQYLAGNLFLPRIFKV